MASNSIFPSSSFCSSSEDEWDIEEQILLDFIIDAPENKNRVENFVTEVVDKYSAAEFKENFRVSKETAALLVEEYETSEYFKKKLFGGKEGISARAQMLSFLWFAGNKTTYREVANLFHISLSTMHRHLNYILKFFFEISKNHIRFPTTTEEKLRTATEFEKISGMKNVLGCIDGSYITIRKPAHKIRSTYVNRHDQLSITLQGICDSEKRFTDVFIGSPSKIHDARIYQLSFISKKIPTICGEDYHILGDAAYPLREYLLTPYKDYGNLTQDQRNFNLKHCQTRVKIENAFGLLKQRFRQLLRLDFFEVETMCEFVLACCVLHNMCINQADSFSEISSISEPESSTNMEADNQREAELRRLGEIKRNKIADIS